MTGHRHTLSCTKCAKKFTYWVNDANAHPKVKCYFCAAEAFPKGEPPAAPAPAPAPSAPPSSAPPAAP